MNNDQILDELRKLREDIAEIKKERMTLLDVHQASELMNLSTSTIYKLTSLKKLPHHKPGGKKIYIRHEDILNYLFKNRIKNEDELVGQAHQIKI